MYLRCANVFLNVDGFSESITVSCAVVSYRRFLFAFSRSGEPTCALPLSEVEGVSSQEIVSYRAVRVCMRARGLVVRLRWHCASNLILVLSLLNFPSSRDGFRYSFVG